MIRVAIIIVLLLLLPACTDSQPDAHYVQEELEVWAHYGTEAERRTLQQQVVRFNESQDAVRINAVILPLGVYHDQIEEAAGKGRLPDILEIDPDYVGYRAWREQLQPLDKMLSDSLRIDLMDPLLQQNMYQGRLYAISPNSRIVMLYARRSLLEQAGVSMTGLLAKPGSHSGQMQLLNELVLDLAGRRASGSGNGRGHAAVIESYSPHGEQWLAEAVPPEFIDAPQV